MWTVGLVCPHPLDISRPLPEGEVFRPSMLKMSAPGKDHRDSVLVTSGDDFAIFYGSAGLNNRGNSCRGGLMDRIGKWKECVRAEHGSACSIARFANRNVNRINAAHLSRTDSAKRLLPSQHNGIRFDVPRNGPSKPQFRALFIRWLGLRHDLPLIFRIRGGVGILNKRAPLEKPNLAGPRAKWRVCRPASIVHCLAILVSL